MPRTSDHGHPHGNANAHYRCPTPRVATVLSQKGGAGKTTLSCALAALASRTETATAILDLYPQEDPYIPDESRSVLSAPARTRPCIGLPKRSSVTATPGSLTTPGAGPETGTPRKSRPAGSRTFAPSEATSYKSYSNKHIPLISKAVGANPETGLKYPERPRSGP